MKVVIIEDEYLMAQALKGEILAVSPSIQVQAMLSTVNKAIQYFEENPLPDLFFSDIELPDGLSFEIFKHLKSTKPVIFCTAYNEYALEAFKANGIEYILKPFNTVRIKETLDKYINLTRNEKDISKELEHLLSSLSKPIESDSKSVLAHQGEKIIPVKVSNIALAYLDSSILYIYTFDNTKFVVNYSIDTLEKIVGHGFIRANRQTLLHRDSIDHVTPYFARKLLVVLKIDFNNQIVISKANSSKFLKWLEKN